MLTLSASKQPCIAERNFERVTEWNLIPLTEQFQGHWYCIEHGPVAKSASLYLITVYETVFTNQLTLF